MTLLGKILAILNVLAAGGFAALAFMDVQRRQTWAYASYQRDVAKEGLPRQEQYNDPRLPRDTYLRDQAPDKDSEGVKKMFQGAGAGAPVTTQVDLLKALRASQGSESFVEAVRSAAQQTAASAKGKEKEVLGRLLAQLAFTGAQRARYEELVAAVGPAKLGQLLEQVARRWMLAQALLPLEEIRPGGQRDQLAYRIADLDKPFQKVDELFQKLDADYKKLEELLAARIDDAMRPVSPLLELKGKTNPGLPLTLLTVKSPHHLVYQRSAADQKVMVRVLDAATNKDAAGDFGQVELRLDNVQGQPTIALAREGSGYAARDEAFKEPHQVLEGEITIAPGGKAQHFFFIEREPLEQRQAIAYALLTLSKVVTPDNAPLGVPTDQRTELVVGRENYIVALVAQTRVLTQIAERRRKEIGYDRDAFVAQYNLEIKDRLPYLIAAIERSKTTLDDWKKQKKVHDDQLEARQAHYNDVLKQVKESRRLATEALAELELWQKRLFAAQRAGSGVAEQNQRLEKKIRKLEKGR